MSLVETTLKPAFEFPRRDQHTLIIGQNGSGKTQCACFVLSRAPLHDMPCIIFDYKREGFFKRLQRRRLIQRTLSPTSAAPRRPGLYLMQPRESDDEAIDDFLWRCHARGNILFYFDEGYRIPAGRGSATRAILTEGRSRRLPVICLVQRPVLVDHFFFTEAKHFCAFKLIDREDRKTVARYAPIDIDAEYQRYHAYWYDNDRDIVFRFPPVPSSDRILEDIAAKAPPHWWWR